MGSTARTFVHSITTTAPDSIEILFSTIGGARRWAKAASRWDWWRCTFLYQEWIPSNSEQTPALSAWTPQNTCVVSCNFSTHFTCLGPFHKTAYSDQLTHAVNLHHILQITCLVALFVYVVVTLPQPGRTKPTDVTKDAKRQPSKHRCIEKYSFKLIGSYMVPFVTCRANCTAKVVSWTIPNTGKTISIVNDCY